MRTRCILLSCFLALGAVAAERSVDVGGGVKIRCIDVTDAAGAKTPILFVTGWRMPAEVWSLQIEHFGKGRRVVAIDPRSQGLSTITPDGNTPEQRAKDLDAVTRALKLDQFLLVGWSQAGQDIAAYVDQFGTSKLKGIVIVDTHVAGGPAELEEHRQFSQQILGFTGSYVRFPREYTLGMIQSICKKAPTEAERALWLERAMHTPVDTGVAMLVADLFQKDRRPALAKFMVPTLIIGAAESPVLQAQKDMAAKLPHGEFVAVDDAAHAVFHDQPAKFNALVETFLKKLE